MSESWNGKSSTNWFTTGNWSLGKVPTVSSTGTESITISGAVANQPTISEPSASSHISVNQGGTVGTVSDYQLDGQLITLTSGAGLTLQGIALGNYLGTSGTTASGATISGLHGAAGATPTFDAHMVIEATGTGVDQLLVDDDNVNFGEIEVASGATLNLTVATGGNAQPTHGLYNYGLISIAAGAEFEVGTVTASGGTAAAFYNPGWIVVNGGTLDAIAGIMDGAATMNSAGSPDGYIEISNSGDVILGNTVAATEEVMFTDTTANTLQITAGTLFSGTVNNFGPSDTIVVNSFSHTSNVTLVTVGSVTKLETTNGSVITTITLTGTMSNEITTGTNSSGQEFIQSGATSFSSGSSTLGSAGNIVTNTSTITVSGSTTDLTIYDSLTGTGAYTIANGATLALDNTQGNDAGQSVIFGTQGSATNPNTLILNGSTAGFGGAITGFAGNDVVDLGGSVLPALPAGDGIELTYASGVLTVAETNSSGAVVSSTTLSLAGTGTLSASSFVALEGTAGLQIELASSQSGHTYSFTDAAATHNFAQPADYAGGIAPGSNIAAGEIVSITSGTASVTTGAILDNGTIVVASTFAEPSTINGTGALSVLANGHATLTGGASLASITDAGTLTLGGAFTGPISLSSGVATIASGFSDASAITGTGTLTVNSGVTATLAAGSSLTAINDFGTIDAAGALSTINMEGNNANSVVDFTGASTATPLTNFGTTDDIILGATALPPGAGTGVALSYNSGVLTVTETSASGSSLSSAHVTVSGTAALTTASFEALYGANGVNIELASAGNANFVFNGGTNTSFENPANFAGGFAPGNSISSAETVTIASGTASVASGAVIDNGHIIDNATFTDTGSLTGSGTLSIGTGHAASLTGGASLASITDAGTLTLGGAFTGPISLSSGVATIASGFSDASAITGTGTLTVNSGVTATLAAGSSLTAINDFGTIDAAGALSTINMEGNNANSVVDFTGASTATPLTNFGTTDDIILGATALPPGAGTGVALSYNSGVLTVTETSASGSSLSSAHVTVSGTAALTTASFEALYGANGVNIELASAGNANFVFNGGTNTSFENPANFAGGFAPGNSISSAETVTIASGTASVASGAVIDNGHIIDNATFTDTGSLTGIGTLSVSTGANASLTGGASLASITDAGTLTLGGAFTGPISLSSGVATIASGFSDASAITGTGTLTVNSGVTATLAAGSSLTAINDFGTIDAAGALSTINMEGNNANSVVDFTGASTATPLTNFGTTDDIILGATALPPGAGTGVALSYNSGVLTVTETSASGSSLSSAHVTVSGTAALTTASFEALYGANGVNIELASAGNANFVFNGGTNTSFENPANFAGGFAPGNSISSAETVTIASGTASVASGAVIDNGKIIDNATFIDTGSLTGIGTLSVSTGANASLTGGASLASITDAGTLTLGGAFTGPISLSSGVATIASGFSDASAITGTGTLTVNSGVTATLAAGSSLTAINDFGTIDLLGALATPVNLEGDAARSLADFTGTDVTSGMLTTPLTNFGKGDTIVLGTNNFSLAGTGDSLTSSYNSATSQLVIDDHTSGTVVTLNVGLTAGDSSSLISLSTAGGVLDISIPCYASGTRILTTSGEVLVEELKVGDTVVTVRENGPATGRIVWTGKRSIDISRHPYPELVRPVRICAGAFGPSVPERDLRLSPHHAVYVNGCLFEAASLINGVTIVQEQATRFVTYHHIELETHDVMLAEGLPAESFLDTGNRDMFEDGERPMQLHADFRSPADAAFCVTMVREGAELEAVRAMLQARIAKVRVQAA